MFTVCQGGEEPDVRGGAWCERSSLMWEEEPDGRGGAWWEGRSLMGGEEPDLYLKSRLPSMHCVTVKLSVIDWRNQSDSQETCPSRLIIVVQKLKSETAQIDFSSSLTMNLWRSGRRGDVWWSLMSGWNTQTLQRWDGSTPHLFKNQETADHSSQFITSSTDVEKSSWTAAEIQEMQRLLVSVAVWLC